MARKCWGVNIFGGQKGGANLEFLCAQRLERGPPLACSSIVIVVDVRHVQGEQKIEKYAYTLGHNALYFMIKFIIYNS